MTRSMPGGAAYRISMNRDEEAVLCTAFWYLSHCRCLSDCELFLRAIFFYFFLLFVVLLHCCLRQRRWKFEVGRLLA